ncbi:MAG: nuclear transport factor 2 family protein [Chitinophagaceae bacterium]
MESNNTAIVDRFFAAYSNHDFAAIRQTMSEDVIWVFLGQHPLGGVKNGIEEVVAFFDNMGAIMGQSGVEVSKLVTGSNDQFLLECQHITTHREDGNNVDHHVCVLWTFENNKIKEGRHFFADPHAANHFFAAVAPIPAE